MSPMDVEPAELCELLAGHHVVLDDVAQHILAVRCWGGSNAAAGELLGYSEGRIRARFERVEDIVLGPSGMKRDLALVTQWLGHHLNCDKDCLLHARMLIEKRSVYAVVKTATPS